MEAPEVGTLHAHAEVACAITNPLEESIMKAILGADALMGNDDNCQAWIAANKPKSTNGGGSGSGRRARRPRK